MATGTTNRHPKKGPAHRVHLLVDNVTSHLVRVVACQHLRADGKEAQTRSLHPLLGEVGCGEEIARQLLDNELVERLVLVERLDDIITIPPSGGMGNILVHPVGIGIAGNIKPVAAPAFAVAGRFQKLINQLPPGVLTLITQEVLNLFNGRSPCKSR
jgi:hypothetical protein